jgi:hypothetical protein
MMTICLIFWRARARLLAVGRSCELGGKVAGGNVAGAAVGEAGIAVGLDPPVFGITTTGGRLVAVPQAERTRMETSITECSRIFIILLSP